MGESRCFVGYFLVAQVYVVLIVCSGAWCLARAAGTYLFWSLIGLLIISYFSIQLGVWAWAIRAIMGRIKPSNFFCRIILSAFLFTTFVIWMERGSLFFFGEFEGFFLFQPLIFLLDSTIIRSLIGTIGSWGTLFILHVLLGMVCDPLMSLESAHPEGVKDPLIPSVFSKKKCIEGEGSLRADKIKTVGLLCLLILISDLLFSDCLISCVTTNYQLPVWLEQCAIVRPPFRPGCSVNSSFHINQIAAQIAQISTAKKIIFMPESAVPFPVSATGPVGAALCSLSRGRVLVFGAHRIEQQADQENIFNTAFCLSDGAISFLHDKAHGMLGFERLPKFLQSDWVIRGLGPLLGTGFFTQADRADRLCRCGGNLPDFLVLICSEFFYRYDRCGIPADTVIVALVNDAWFAGTFIPALLVRTARLRALELQRGILYLSYFHATTFGLYCNS